jgi:peptide-methionine (R)-S-oxide reductase
VNKDKAELKKDICHYMKRTEFLCAGSHPYFGNVFSDKPFLINKKYCINSAALKFRPKKQKNNLS